jgi:O-Antigen ligase
MTGALGTAARRGLPALVAVLALGCGLSPLFHGYYALSTWGVIAFVILGVAWGLLMAGQSPPGRLAVIALAGLVALAAVALLSITWAESIDNALTGAGRWVLYASAFGIFAVAVRGAGVARLGMAAATGGILIVAGYLLVKMIAGDGASLFYQGRLHDPLGSINSEGLFMILAVWPLVGVAQHARAVPAGLAAGGATGLLALAFLSQSRSVALAFAAGLVGAMLVPGRLQRAWLVLLLAAAVAAISSPLIDVYDQGRTASPGFDDAIRSAGGWIVLAAAGAGVAWGAVVAGRPRFGTPGLKRASAIALGVLALLGAGVVVARADRLGTYIRDQSRAFTSLQHNTGPSRLLAGGGNRYDYWRISLHEFADHPLGGVGADNFTRDYFIRRATIEDIRQPHSIAFQTLAELGLLGTLALAVFLAAVAVGVVRHLRGRSLAPPERALLVATVGGVLAWLAHASVDWPHLIPGATGIVLLAAAYLVTEPGADDQAENGRGPVGVPGIAVRALLSVGIVAGAVVIGRAVLSVHYLDQGKAALDANPVRAIQKANDALAFNGDSLQALYLKSAGYARLGDYARSRAALLEASRLEPHNFLPWALLGDLDARRGEVGEARRAYARAFQLNPQGTFLRDLSRNPAP